MNIFSSNDAFPQKLSLIKWEWECPIIGAKYLQITLQVNEHTILFG